MPAIITDTFDYDDIVRVLDLDEAFVHHQIDALQPKYWRIVIKTKPKGLKIFSSKIKEKEAIRLPFPLLGLFILLFF